MLSIIEWKCNSSLDKLFLESYSEYCMENALLCIYIYLEIKTASVHVFVTWLYSMAIQDKRFLTQISTVIISYCT